MKPLLFSTFHIIRNLLNPFLRFREVSILCYHSISDDQSETSVSANRFEEHIKTLKGAGYDFVSLEEIFVWFSKNASVPQKAVGLSFDDGYADFKTTVLPILEKYNISATLFLVGDREQYRLNLGTDLAMLSDADVVELQKHPLISFGWHTKTHPNLGILPKESMAQEIIPPTPMSFFAYPGGNYSENAINAVQNAGFSAAFSIKRDLVSRGKNRWLLPRVVILKSDSGKDLEYYVSVAQHWYASLRNFFKKYG